MVKRVLSVFLCITVLACTSMALAGGAPMAPRVGGCAGAPYGYGPGPGVPYSNYWGDAPFPGLCGGVVALPFLVVGSLLGGNTMAPPPYGAMPGGAYNCAPRPCPPAPCAPAPCAPAPCGPAPAACGPGYGGSGGFLGGLPCLELCSGLLGAVTGGTMIFP
jgi:hypothetical protein